MKSDIFQKVKFLVFDQWSVHLITDYNVLCFLNPLKHKISNDTILVDSRVEWETIEAFDDAPNLGVPF